MTRQRRPTTRVKRLTLEMVLTEAERAALEARELEIIMDGKAASTAERAATREALTGRNHDDAQ